MQNVFTPIVIVIAGFWLLKEIVLNFYHLFSPINILLFLFYIFLILMQIIAYKIGISGKRRGKLPLELNNLVIKVCKKGNITSPVVYIINRNEPRIYSSNFISCQIVIIYTGLIKILTKDELEAVLYHEIYHLKKGSTLITVLVFLLLFIVAGGVPSHAIAVYIMVAVFNRRIELKADLFAVELSTPEIYLEALRKASGNNYEKNGWIHELLSSHPSLPERVKNVQTFSN